MSETAAQRSAIDSRGKTIVSASAGSGKTFVMVARYVDLVASGAANVDTMLAVTFTNKAAAQMRDRIRKALTERVKGASEQEKARLKEQLRALPLAEISTIHAFCGRLVRTYFYLVGVDPAFRIVGDDEAEGKSISLHALDKTFEEAYERRDDDFTALLEVYFRKKNDRRLRALVEGFYREVRANADYRALLERIAEGEDVFEKAERLLTEDIRLRAGVILQKAKLIDGNVVQAEGKLGEYLSKVLEIAHALSESNSIFSMRELSSIDLPRAPQRRKTLPQETLAAITQAQSLGKRLKIIFENLAGYHVREVERERCDKAGMLARALARLTLAYDENYSAAKQDAGVLDYGDLEHYALAVLQSPDSANVLREKYTHVFIDEYQDINPMQEKILSALCQSDVFLVGDKKQAIYGFRGSKSQYFTDKTVEFRAQGNSLMLAANFRSAAQILNAVNRVFRAAMPDYEPMEYGGLYGDYEGEVQLHYLPQAEKTERERGVYSVKDAGERLAVNPIAEKVVELVERECGRKERLGREWYDSNLQNADGTKGGMRSVRYGDIAVLVRKNTKAAGAIVAALSERGIPVTASAEVNICDYFEVRLLLDWLSYLDNAEQDIPMATAMLSVLGGFSDRELAVIRIKVERVNRIRTRTFREACLKYLELYGMTNDGIARKLKRFYTLCERYRDLKYVHTASEMLVLLLAEGLEAQIAAKGDAVGRLARVRRFVTESEGSGGVHDFLRRIKDGGYRVDFSETGGENAVQVLTMHASKGLEFPVVILTELCEAFRGADSDDVMWTDDFHIAPRYYKPKSKEYGETLVRKAAALCERQAELEGELNLLYVGMTRACYRLHMLFEKEQNTEDDGGFSYDPLGAKCLADFIPHADMLAYLAPEEEKTAWDSGQTSALVYRVDEALVKKIALAGAPYRYLESTKIPVKDSATGLMKKLRIPVYKADENENGDSMSELEGNISDMDGVFTVESGLAYHAFLEHVQFGKDARGECARMRAEGLLSEEQIALLDIERLDAILKIPYFGTLESKELWRERKFLVTFPASEFKDAYQTSANDEIVFQGAIDLLVKDSRDAYTVVDYKFSSHDDERIRSDYALQMRLYRKTVAKIMRIREECVKVRIVNIAKCREIEIR